MLVAQVMGDTSDSDHEFRRLRTMLMETPTAKSKLPRFLDSCRTLHEFWGIIMPKFPSYQERRELLRVEFEALISML